MTTPLATRGSYGFFQIAKATPIRVKQLFSLLRPLYCLLGALAFALGSLTFLLGALAFALGPLAFLLRWCGNPQAIRVIEAQPLTLHALIDS